MRTASVFSMAFFIAASLVPAVGAAAPDDYQKLKKDVEELKQRLAKKNSQAQVNGPIGRADASIAGKYGPNTKVTTKEGKLTIGGLLQVWAYHIQNDNKGVYALLDRKYNDLFQQQFPNAPDIVSRTGGWNDNALNDNDSARIRRAEIKFSIEMTPDITGVVMIDPAGGDEANTYPSMPTNQGVVGSSPFGAGGDVDIDALGEAGFWVLWSPVPIPLNQFGRNLARPNSLNQSRMQNGFMRPNRILQDAYINYHSQLIPNHDFTIGQFKPPMSEEGNRNSGQLDFAERAMVNQFSNQRDLGIMVHGSWRDGRFQYWLGGFNSAGNFHNTFASFQNRSDDNDAKDLAYRILLRPLWNKENWGSLELGYSAQYGIHGESGDGLQFLGNFLFFAGANDVTQTVDGLSRKQSSASRQYAWLWYRPAGPVQGWWLRGEWGHLNDRPAPGTWNVNAPVMQPNPYKRFGWYFATGYKLSDSIFADDLKNGNWIGKMIHDMEFCYRYEVFGNIVSDNLTKYRPQVLLGNGESLYLVPTQHDVFKTQVHTAGLNYYWKGYNVRTQINYMWVNEPNGHFATAGFTSQGRSSFSLSGRRFREVKNDVFLVSHQIMW